MKPIAWQVGGLLVANVDRADGRRLGLIVTGEFKAVALEGSQNSGNDVQAIFKDHGHKEIGDFFSIPEAIAAAEKFAEHWAAGIDISKCGCEEIPTPPRLSRRRRAAD